MKRIGIVTTGGDAPGMNAAIRATARIASSKGLEVLGFKHGWDGLMTDTFIPLTPRSVSGIIQQGGTILHTYRSKEFETREGIRKAVENLSLNDVEGLVVIGGDGSMRGALELSRETEALIVGVPASIDNDVYGTEESIGFDTAINTAVAEIDKIRDTAISHERVFIVEVMGRERGFLALTIGLTVGAEIILIPEKKFDERQIVEAIHENAAKGKKSGIIVAAEGIGDTHKLARQIEKDAGVEVRLSILGYAQRGGSPTARSRLLANLFAEEAVRLFVEGRGGRVVGLQNGKITSISLEKSCKTQKPLDLTLLELADTLST